MFFLLVVLSIPVLGLAWWWWADRRLRRLPGRRATRPALAVFVLAHIAGFAWLFASRMVTAPGPPGTLVASTYIWSLILLPLTVAWTIALEALRLLFRAFVARGPGPEPVPDAGGSRPHPTEPRGHVTRRQALAGFAMVGAPLAAHAGTVARGLSQLDEFRVREIELGTPRLPPELDGLTIAHVSDTHVGRFTRGRVLDLVAQRVHDLDADLVCFTGDLIDYSLSDLPEAMAMLRRFRARHGVYIAEGNHDLFQDRRAFRAALRRAELGLLVNEAATAEIRGRRVQILGLRWGDEATASRGAFFERNTLELSQRLDPGAFSILLSHHPHAFDDAARAGIPLTLAGHTHGGQLNFAEGFGPVQAVFRYMSGLYSRPSPSGPAACVVSNGVGNWFPLRVNAPAEIIRLTLRSAPA